MGIVKQNQQQQTLQYFIDGNGNIIKIMCNIMGNGEKRTKIVIKIKSKINKNGIFPTEKEIETDSAFGITSHVLGNKLLEGR